MNPKTYICIQRKCSFSAFALIMFFTTNLLAQAPNNYADYPSRPIKFIIPQAPGGGTDLIGRKVAQKLSEQLKQPTVVENKTGAGSLVGTEFAANAASDGYTLMIGGLFNMVMNKALIKDLSYDPEKSFIPLGYISAYSFVLLAKPDLPVNSFAEFFKYAKERPNQLNFASAGIGTLQHVWGTILFNGMGLNLTHVPFKGAAQGYQEMLGGRIDVMFDNMSASKQYIQTNKLKGLSLSSLERNPLIPQVPTINETGVTKFNGESWFALFAPINTPVQIVSKLRTSMELINKDPEFIAQVEKDGGRMLNISSQDQQQFLKDEINKWVSLVNKNNIKAE
jgi:tripartite-type tricarboxylate transporter receptor subunit TctC